jgi:CelD/BcsL family acetyltransferase involved in cellulose biosynthesis
MTSVDQPAAFSRQPLTLPFYLGDWLVAEAQVPAVYLRTHVAELDTDPRVHFKALDRDVSAQVLVLPSHPVPADWPRLQRTSAMLIYSPSRHAHSLIDISESFSAYLAGRPRKHRHEIDRKVRRYIEATGAPVHCRIYRTPGEVAQFFDVVAPLAAKTYQARLLRRGMPLDERFRLEALRAAAADDVRAAALLVGGRPIAFGFCRAAGDRLDYIHTGYAATARNLAPGYVLLHAMLEHFLAEGRFRLIDLGFGDAQYKRCFATRSLSCATIQVWRRNPRNLALVRAHMACDRVSALAASLLDRAGLKPALKRVLRR